MINMIQPSLDRTCLMFLFLLFTGPTARPIPAVGLPFKGTALALLAALMCNVPTGTSYWFLELVTGQCLCLGKRHL